VLRAPQIYHLDKCQDDISETPASGTVTAVEKRGLDPGIARAVRLLQEAGIETFESCEGGGGHSFLEPTIRFHGGPGAGWVALGRCISLDLKPEELRRVWDVLDRNDPTGPYWEITFREKPC